MRVVLHWVIACYRIQLPYSEYMGMNIKPWLKHNPWYEYWKTALRESMRLTTPVNHIIKIKISNYNILNIDRMTYENIQIQKGTTTSERKQNKNLFK